jgi:NADH-quinone oxidoreductase subunit M
MTGWLTTILIVLPLAGALVVWLAPLPRATVGSLATLISLLEVAFWIIALERFHFGDPALQLGQQHTWFRDLGVSYHVGQYGFSLWLVGLTAICGAAASAYAWWVGRERPRAYFGLLLFLTGAVVGVFSAQDLLLFYAFFEAMLIPLYVLIGVWGGAGRLGATLKFVVYTVAGSLLMLTAIVVYGLQQGTFDLTKMGTSGNDWLFLGFALAFAVKAPLWPFHGWLPDAYREAPPEVAGLLSGVVSKVAAYGFLRIAIDKFPGPAHHFHVPILVLAAIGLVYGSLLAFRAPDIRGVIAYSSLAQMGLITFGLFAANDLGVDGAVLQMVNHGLLSMTLFLLAGMIERRTATGEFVLLGGMARGRPALATVLMTVGVMALAVPLSSNFAGEFLILAGVFQQNWVWAAIGAAGIVLAAMYMLRLISAVLHREVGAAVSDGALDLRGGELTIVLPLVAVLIGLSAWPAAISARVLPGTATGPPTPTVSEAVALRSLSGGVAAGIPSTSSPIRSTTLIPARCAASVSAFTDRSVADAVRAEVDRYPDGGWVVTLSAQTGAVSCPGGGHVEISLPRRRVSLGRRMVIHSTAGSLTTVLGDARIRVVPSAGHEVFERGGK